MIVNYVIDVKRVSLFFFYKKLSSFLFNTDTGTFLFQCTEAIEIT